MTGPVLHRDAGTRNGAGAEISQAKELLQQSVRWASKAERNRARGCLFLRVIILSEKQTRSRRSQQSQFLCRAPGLSDLLDRVNGVLPTIARSYRQPSTYDRM